MKNKIITVCLLFISFTCTCAGARGETVSADVVPWSGYWWPHYEGGLITGKNYHDHPAPLEKYDLLVHHWYPSSLTNWYRNAYYDPYAPGWYGHCYALARAAVAENYPIFPSSEENVIFRVGDKKGLLTIAHSGGTYEVGSGFADTFHLWLLKYIKEQKLPFIADLDNSEQKWYYPIFKYDMETQASGNMEHVQVTIYYANNFVSPDYMGTDVKTATYTYDLQLDSDGDIIAGDWTGYSVDNHPDVFIFPLQRGTVAPDLDYQLIKKIAENEDDFLEPDGLSAVLSSGKWNLVLLNQDSFTVDAQSGEELRITVKKLAGSSRDMRIHFSDHTGNGVDATLSETEPTVVFKNNSPKESEIPYTISFEQDDYRMDPNLYRVIVDSHRKFEQNLPVFIQNSAWHGFAIVNNSDEVIKNASLITRGEDGAPLQTVWRQDIAAGQKEVFLFQDTDYRKTEYNYIKSLTIQADSQVSVVALVGLNNKPWLLSQVQGDNFAPRIIVPRTKKANWWKDTVISYVTNNSLYDNHVSAKVFSADGSLRATRQFTLSSFSTAEIKPGTGLLPDLPEDGWIDLQSINGIDLSAYTYLRGESSLDGVYAQPPSDAIRYIPHVPENDSWQTSITLINGSDELNEIRIHPLAAASDLSYDQVVSLMPRQRVVVTVALSPAIRSSILSVIGAEKFSGFFSYKNIDSGEVASYPLLSGSDARSELTVAHHPHKPWWTGLALANSGSSSATVRIFPYDNEGREVATPLEMELPAGRYSVFSVSTLFSDDALEKIEWLSIKAVNGVDEIMGLYLYGLPDNSSLSGSVL